MHRLLIVLLSPALLVFACSDEGKCPYGSECTQMDCSCTDVYCDYYSQSVYKDIKITYKNGAQTIVGIDLQTNNTDPIAGHEYTGDEIAAGLVGLNCPISNCQTNMVATQSHCKIDTYGGVNSHLEGSCTFIFHLENFGDMNAYMPFNCTLNQI